MKTNRHHILIDKPGVQTLASLVKLSRYYQRKQLSEWLSFREKLLDEFIEKNGYLCCEYCGKKNLIKQVPDNSLKQPHNLATIDHVYPISRGGKRYDKHNCVISCYSCNQSKRDKICA